jgi:prephenate dehydratase
VHTITIIATHPQALAEARKLVDDFDPGVRNRVRLVTSPALERIGRAQVQLDAEGATLRDLADTLHRAGFL